MIAGWAGEENIDPRTEEGFRQVSFHWWVFLLWPSLEKDRYLPAYGLWPRSVLSSRSVRTRAQHTYALDRS